MSEFFAAFPKFFCKLEKDSTLYQLVEDYFNAECMDIRSCALIKGDDEIRAKRFLLKQRKVLANGLKLAYYRSMTT